APTPGAMGQMETPAQRDPRDCQKRLADARLDLWPGRRADSPKTHDDQDHSSCENQRREESVRWGLGLLGVPAELLPWSDPLVSQATQEAEGEVPVLWHAVSAKRPARSASRQT